MAFKYILKWEKEGKALIIPVRIEKAYSNDYGFKAELVCEHCVDKDIKLKQYYYCEGCKRHYTLKDINLRRDKETGVIYDKRALQQFLDNEVKKEINIIDEIDVNEIIINIEFIEHMYELYSDEFNEYIAKIHKYLAVRNKALLGTIGWKGEEKAVFIIASHKKLILAFLRDARLLKNSKGEVEQLNSQIRQRLEALTEYSKIDKYMKFIEMVANGEEIKVEPKPQKAEAVITADWLEV